MLACRKSLGSREESRADAKTFAWSFFQRSKPDKSGRENQELRDVCGVLGARFEVTPKEGSLARAKLFRHLSMHSG